MIHSTTESVLLPHGPTAVRWRRSARARRLSLRVDLRDGAIVVTLPPRATVAGGRAMLLEHAGWVADRLARLPDAILLEHDAVVPFCGQSLRLRHSPGAAGTRLVGQELLVSGSAEFLHRRVVDFFRCEARRRLSHLAYGKAERAEGGPLRLYKVVVKDTRTRWGSCTADGTIMFSWRLLLAPEIVQDYVVAHEVAHLRHMNHGEQFWALVASLSPHRAAAVRWLERGGAGLMRIG